MSIINKLVSFYKKNKVKTIVLSLISVVLLIINTKIFFPIILVSFLTYLWIKSGKKGIDQKKKCSHCKNEIDYLATKCPHCQSKIYVWTAGTKIILGMIVLIVIILVNQDTSGLNYSTPEQPSAEQIVEMKKHDFAKLAKMNVEGMLKSPSTAKFNTSPVVKLEDKTYSIDSWVDSENTYGAMIRSYWSAKAHYIGGDTRDETIIGANWIIDEFVFDGEKIK
ncbi:hypothetical protein HXX01_04550 [Candidatus Nomurabacteria bacterium]|nr:hypothetical protein [Candidatus Nomurabacteria bacterium]